MKRIAVFALFGFLVVAAGAALAGYPLISPDVFAGLSVMGGVPFMVGDLTPVEEIKTILQKQGEAWEDFKKTNDEILKAKAEGKAVADLEAKLAKVSADLDKIEEIKAEVDKLILKANRPNLSDVGDADLQTEVKTFNITRRAAAPAGTQLPEIDAEAYKAYKSAYWQMFRKGNVDMLSSDERKALQAGVDTDGGYLLPTPTAGRIAKKVYELSPIRQIASVMNISTDALEGINDLDEATAGWVAETGTRSDSATPVIGKYRIEAAEMYSMPKATQKLLDDAAVDVEAWLANKVADKFARLEGAAFVNGTGVGQPRGFSTYPLAATADGTRAWGTIEKIKSGLNGGFTNGDALFDLIGAFKTAYLQKAKFVTIRSVIAALRKLKTTTTLEYIWQPGLQAGQPDKLLGYPIVMAQDLAALTTSSVSLYFGDWEEAYQIVDRIGIRTLRDPFTAKPYVVFYSTKRVGGGVLNFEAIKGMNFDT
jgi:HK97 family phage major capsid protein